MKGEFTINKKHIILGSLVLPLTGLTNEMESEAFFNLNKIKIESRLKVSKDIAHQKDIYKTTIKFKAIQK